MNLYRAVFLADDDTDDQEIFMDALKEIDGSIQCSCAHDGEDALNMLSDGVIVRPELIFLDLNMPRLNGKQVLAELKKRDGLKDIPVIMYSTYFGEADIKEIKALGAVHFLQKPTEFAKFIQALRFVLAKKW